MSESLPVIDMPVNIDMDVDKGKLLLEILQNAAKYNHGFNFNAGGNGKTMGAGTTPSKPQGVPTGAFNPGAVPGSGGPGSARGISGAIGNAALNALIAPLILLGKATSLTAKSLMLFGTALKKTTGVMRGIFTTAIKWTLGIATLVGGGLFGYNRLAKSVSNDFNTSSGLRVSTAFNKAYNTVWGNKLEGAGGLLAAVSKAKGNLASDEARTLYGLGINPNSDVQNNTLTALRSAWAFARQNRDNTNGQGEFAIRYGGINLGGMDFNQLGRMDEGAFNETAGELIRQIKNNEISESTQKSYQDTLIHLEGNIDSIVTTFKNSLVELNPEIKNFSDAITKNLNVFLKGNGKELFKMAGDGLKSFSDYLNDPQFLSDMKSLKSGVIQFADGVVRGMEILGLIPDKKTSWWEGTATGFSQVWGDIKNYIGNDLRYWGINTDFGRKEGRVLGNPAVTNDIPGIPQMKFDRQKDVKDDFMDFLNTPPPMNQQNDRHYRRILMHKIGKMNDEAGFPKNLMSAVAYIESKFDPNAVSPDSGARGVWQLKKETSEGYGLNWDDAFDPEKSSLVARKYIYDNLNRYGGDITKTLAQYNGGNIAVKGNKLNLKLETIKYLLDALDMIPDMSLQHPELRDKLTIAKNKAGSGRVEIDLSINNSPGSDINVQTTSTLATSSAMRFNGIPR